MSKSFFVVLIFLFLLLVAPSKSQRAPSPTSATSLGCNGVELTYTAQSWKRIRPFLTSPADQPFSFQSTAIVLNSGTRELDSWELLIGFSHRELIVSVANAVLTDGSDLPYSTNQTSPTSFSGSPNADLKTPIATAGDLTQIEAEISFIGTLFGASNTTAPLPKSLSLSDPSLSCPPVTRNGSVITTCCVLNPDFKDNLTTTADGESVKFMPRRSGDITMSYDVLQSYDSSYLALVTIQNHNDLGRLDNWRLSWEWMRGEFINTMKGAYPNLVTVIDCINGPQAQFYQNTDFSKALNCQRRPTLVDLPPGRYNDTELGKITNCCRNGTILPPSMDPSQSISAFQIQVMKMPPDVNKTKLFPPQNWRIAGSSAAMNPDYICGQPMRVSPTVTPDPSGLDSSTVAIASWQVVCNISQPKGYSPKCCVSFSAFYNDSVVPCKTCACGCPAARLPRSCNASAPALLLPPQALLLPFDNRTRLATEWASLQHFSVPSPMPCSDNCGISINWHVLSDYSKGWTARVTLFNWNEDNFADWFAAVVMDKAYDGFEAMYSFNGTAVGNNTIFMQGLPGLNYLVGETNGTNPDDPRVPGKQQSVVSFTKKMTPGINVVEGDGFPKKVFFNGEECSLPDFIPMSGAHRMVAGSVVTFICLLALVLLSQ